MRINISRSFAVLVVVAAILLTGAVSGCAGGWGDIKPTVASTSSNSNNGVSGTTASSPTSQRLTVLAGQPATFSVSPQGTGPFQFQWYLNGQPIAGATSSTYTISSTTPSQDGNNFTVSVTNAAGSVTAGPYTLVVQSPPAIVQQPATQTVTAGQTATFSVAATGTAPMSYQWAQNGTPISGATSSSFTTPATSVSGSGSSFSVTVTNAAGSVTSTAATLTVSPIVPVLSFAPIGSKAYGNPAFPVTANSASNGAITYSVLSGPATISGNTVTLTGAGTVVLQASQAASGNYAAATQTVSLPVAVQQAPTIGFANIPQQTYGNPPFQISATSVSSAPITYSVVSGPATISGNTVTITGAGTVVLQASQAASTDYAAGTQTISFTVAPATPTLQFAPIPQQVYGAAPFAVSAGSQSSGAITYSVLSGPATISGNTVALTGAGTVVLQASQAASGNYAAGTQTISFTVAPATPTLQFTPIPQQVYGAAPFAISASSQSSGAITYSVLSGPATISGNMVTLTGAGTVVLQASQAASGNYAAGTQTVSFPVAAQTPTINFGNISPQTYGNAPFQINATSTSSAPITYSVVSGPATISGNTVTITGGGTVVLQASQVASGIYAAGTQTTSFTVAPAAPALQFTVADQVYSTTPFAVSASSQSNGAITYSVASGPATVSGNMVTLTDAGTVVLNASQAATTNYAAATATTSFNVVFNVQMTPVSPANITMAPGTQTFSAGVTGGATNNVSWTASGGTITSSGMWTSPNTAGTYTITATSADEPTLSKSTTVTISAPVITAQPVSQSICGNGTISLSVTAQYASSYQWSLNGTPVPGATSSTYIVSAASSAYSGTYTVTVSNPAGSVTSQQTIVQVGSTITTQPSSLTITQYQTAGFNVAASGMSPFTYQWYQVPSGGSATIISGATAGQYITPVQTSTTSSPVGYYATVTDSCGTVLTTNTANLTVNAGNSPPTITTQPVGQTTPSGGTPTFSVTAVGSGTLSYQWYKIPNAGVNNEIAGGTPQTGTLISGATSPTYTLPASATTASNDQDVYYVKVSNAYGQAVSQRATLAVDAGVQIQITGEPTNAYANPGNSASFTVTAASTLPLTYQWYEVPAGKSAAQQTVTQFQGSGTTTTTLPASAVPIQGATSPTYSIPAVDPGMNANVYYVVVSNGHTASVYSNGATLFVGPPSDIPSCSSNWNVLGTTTAFDATTCSYQLTAATTNQYGEIVWPALISTANIQLRFAIDISNPSNTPADGFAVVLGDPSLGATLTSAGAKGYGLGAQGIPGFVVAFDDYYNPGLDPSSTANPDYLGVGRGESTLWENPYFNVNKNLPGGALALAQPGRTVSHSYVVNIVNGYMNVTMDGSQVFSGSVNVPPVAYLYVTSSTGGSWEQTVISNIEATVAPPAK